MREQPRLHLGGQLCFSAPAFGIGAEGRFDGDSRDEKGLDKIRATVYIRAILTNASPGHCRHRLKDRRPELAKRGSTGKKGSHKLEGRPSDVLSREG